MIRRRNKLKVFNYMDEIIDIIRDEMISREMSMTAMAEFIGCGRPYLHRVFSGEQSPSPEWVSACLDKFGMELSISIVKK